MSAKDGIARFPLIRWLYDRGISADSTSEHVRLDCPHCRGRLTLSINVASKWGRCFKCADGGRAGRTWRGSGDLLDVICLLEGVDRRTAYRRIEEYSGVHDVHLGPAKKDADPPKAIIPSDAIPVQKADKDHPSRRILRDRKMDHLEPFTYLCVDGEYANRWILSCYQFGVLVGFEAKSYVRAKPPSKFPIWFKTGKHIYTTKNWDYSRDFAVITESVFDAETLGVNAVGLYGSKLAQGQLRRLLDLRDRGVKRLVWFLDWDARVKQRDIILQKTSMFFDNYRVEMPQWTDPNELGKDRCWEIVGRSRYVGSALDCQESLF